MNKQRLFAVILFLGGLYACLVACQNQETIKKAQYITNGQKLYTTHCQNCHGSKGEGLSRLYPPLNDTEFLNEHRMQLPAIVRFGMNEAIEVNGISFDTEMPANPQLSTIEVAYILTYITNAFGNSQGLYSVEEVEENLGIKKGFQTGRMETFTNQL